MGHLRKLPNSVLRDCRSSTSCLEDQKKMWTFVKHEAFSSARSIKFKLLSTYLKDVENLENSTALEVTGDLYITYLELTGPDAFALYHICIAFWNFHVSGDDHAIFEDVLALFRPSGTLEVRTIRMSFLGAVVFGWGKNSLFFRWCVISPVKKTIFLECLCLTLSI